MRYVLIVVFFICSCIQGIACDICGCQLGGYSFGILSQNPTHFIGVRYSQAHFRADIDNTFLEDEYSNDTYRTIELMGRYVINKKWQLSAVIPYAINEMRGNVQNVNVYGIGDPVLIGYYNIINTSYNNPSRFIHSLMLGAGVKFPLGAYDAVDNDAIINRNFQLGSGSMDYMFSSIYTVKHKSFGLNIETSYKLNTHNDLDYRFGDQVSASSKLFYAIINPNYSLLPYLSVSYEYADMHEDQGFMQVNTGGSAVLGAIGLQTYYKKLMFMSSVDLPLVQNYNTDSRSNIEANIRFNLGVVMNFTSENSQKVMLMDGDK